MEDAPLSGTRAWRQTSDRAEGCWDDAVALARLAVGHELGGTMRAMVDLAREHALERVQFDRPIAGFQAVPL